MANNDAFETTGASPTPRARGGRPLNRYDTHWLEQALLDAVNRSPGKSASFADMLRAARKLYPSIASGHVHEALGRLIGSRRLTAARLERPFGPPHAVETAADPAPLEHETGALETREIEHHEKCTRAGLADEIVARIEDGDL